MRTSQQITRIYAHLRGIANEITADIAQCAQNLQSAYKIMSLQGWSC